MQDFRDFVHTRLGRGSAMRGFVTGVVLTLAISAGIVSASHAASAGNFPKRHMSDTAVTSTVSENPVENDAPASGSTFGGQAEAVANQPASTAVPAAPTNRYVALGDSVAAGLGLPLIANATAQDTTCGRSSQSYAYEVGRQLSRPSTLTACSGATAGDLNTQQGISGPNPPSQLSAAFVGGTPALISITAGANDSYWQRFVQKCYASTCGTSSDTTIANTALKLMQAKYKVAMENIRIRSAANATAPPTVVLTGYYNPLSAACLGVPSVSSRLTQAELTWLEGSVAALNKTISDMAASYSGFARYAAIDFAGHDICSAEPWVQGISDTAPIHPTAAGQQAIARAVVLAVNR